LADYVESADRTHQVVVHPEPAHRVMHGGVDAHWLPVRVLVRDALVHLEEIPVALTDRLGPEPMNRIGEIEVHPASAGPHAAPLVAYFFRSAARDVARREVPKARVLSLEVVVPVVLRDVPRLLAAVFLFLRHPHTSVVAQ